LLGAVLYLPQSWIEDATRRAVARISASISFQEKWRQAITLIRRARAAGLQLTGVVANAEFGDITAFRQLLHQWRLPYALGISHHLTVFRGTPAVHIPPDPRTGRPRSQLVMVDRKTAAIAALVLGSIGGLLMGVSSGIILTAFLNRPIASWTDGVLWDPLPLVSTVALFVCAVVCALPPPARRAMSADPFTLLRS
jgi:hypothetical protein